MRKFAKVSLSAVLILACTKNSEPVGKPPAPASMDTLGLILESIKTSPSYENHIALGLELATRNRHPEAIAAYSKAIEINPKAPIAYNNICAAFNAQERYADAIESCEKAVALEPGFELAKNNLRLANEKFEESRRTMSAKKTKLLNTQVGSEEAINVGMQFFLVRDLEAANAMWKRIKSTDPLYPTALNNLASSYIIAGKFADAERALDEALRLQPGNPLFANNRKWLEQKKAGK